jgi:hypothetical protein
MRSRSFHGRLDRLESQLSSLVHLRPTPSEPTWFSQLSPAVAAEQRPAVEAVVRAFPERGYGLYAWVTSLREGGYLPARIPAEVIDVYLTDDAALPMQHCEDCGLLLPLRPGRHCGPPVEPPQSYFDTCPICNGRVGWYAYWHKHGRNPGGASDLPRQPVFAP